MNMFRERERDIPPTRCCLASSVSHRTNNEDPVESFFIQHKHFDAGAASVYFLGFYFPVGQISLLVKYFHEIKPRKRIAVASKLRFSSVKPFKASHEMSIEKQRTLLNRYQQMDFLPRVAPKPDNKTDDSILLLSIFNQLSCELFTMDEYLRDDIRFFCPLRLHFFLLRLRRACLSISMLC